MSLGSIDITFSKSFGLNSLVKNGLFYPRGKNRGIGVHKVLGMGQN